MLDIAREFGSIGCRCILPKKQVNIYNVRWTSKGDTTRIINYLYSDATIYLERKKQKAEKILDKCNNRELCIEQPQLTLL
jgi:hypothetical protein